MKQLIHIGPNTHLTPLAIQSALQRAYSNRMYAKFYTDGYFIQVNFMKDYTINISSNIKDPRFITALWKEEQRGWSFQSAKNFIYTWMQLNRRVLR